MNKYRDIAHFRENSFQDSFGKMLPPFPPFRGRNATIPTIPEERGRKLLFQTNGDIFGFPPRRY